MKTLKVSEQEIVRVILGYLGLMRFKPIHVRNTGNIFTDREGKRRFGKTADNQRGAPDIILSIHGKSVAFEVKSAVGKQSDEQGDWEIAWKKSPSSGHYWLVRSLDDVQKILAEYYSVA